MRGSRYAQSLPGNRALLYAEFARALEQGAHFPQVFRDLIGNVPSCFDTDLNALASRIESSPEIPLLTHLQTSSLFWEWELRLMKLGLATLRIGEMAARLCEHYVSIEKSSRQIALLIAALIALGVVLIGLVGVGLGWTAGASGPAVILVGAATILALVGKSLAAMLMRQWGSPDSTLWSLLQSLTGGCSCRVVRSLHAYLLNLGLCIQSGQSVPQSARLASQAESVAWLRRRYISVADAVGRGEPLSRSFAASGLLALGEIHRLPEPEGEGGGTMWSPGIIEAVRQSFVEQLGTQAMRFSAALLLGWSLMLALMLWPFAS